MNNQKSNPWNFHNTDKSLISPNDLYRAVYYDLNEIAMGAPLGGSCFIEGSDNTKIKLHDWCGGPPVWEKTGFSLAIPVWTKNNTHGTFQQIAVMDMGTRQFKIFKKKYKVLQLSSFDTLTIHGYDSPLFNPESILFDINHEKIDYIINLND
ncbi:hypothetical protein ASG22_01955 [Chryseobacterium sp. Leaf405]|uniref:hypothetical protein n=1 Tax=Chryseobacterium sp. Leaf405 TaxID=1736367 RepID=UPI0006FF7798|nr:hypothetical protein [Chryseobacterium sp. Leaf405]KQT35808.1 hypothetical protein ASG22_01955 [Chryseobacterium sp. Leaf405]